MKRLLIVIVGALVMWLGILASADSIPSAAVYGYDGLHHRSTNTATSTERGPPQWADADTTIHDAVDRESHGPSPRSDAGAPRAVTTYGPDPKLAQVASAATTTPEVAQDAWRTSSALAHGRVAAETEGAVTSTVGRDAAESCLNSFTADTPITMADGSQEPISKVKVGDKVLATDPETGQTKAEPVAQLIRHSGWHEMVLISLADGSVLDSTDGHPIWDNTTGRFTDASQLHAGDNIETSNGELISITGLTDYSDDLTAYNLQIQQIHTYYAGTTPVLVHNSCGYTPAGGFADADIDEVAQTIYQHIGEGDISGRPGLSQIQEALTRGTPEPLTQGDGSITQMINYRGVRVILNEDLPWRSTAFFPGG